MDIQGEGFIQVENRELITFHIAGIPHKGWARRGTDRSLLPSLCEVLFGFMEALL